MAWNQYAYDSFYPNMPTSRSYEQSDVPQYLQYDDGPEQMYDEGEVVNEDEEWMGNAGEQPQGNIEDRKFHAPQSDSMNDQNLSHSPVPSISTPSPQKKPNDNHVAAKLAELRAKLLAKRATSNPPRKTEMPSQIEGQQVNTAAPAATFEPKSAISGLDTLLAEGKAAAEAKAKQSNDLLSSSMASKVPPQSPLEKSQKALHRQAIATPRADMTAAKAANIRDETSYSISSATAEPRDKQNVENTLASRSKTPGASLVTPRASALTNKPAAQSESRTEARTTESVATQAADYNGEDIRTYQRPPTERNLEDTNADISKVQQLSKTNSVQKQYETRAESQKEQLDRTKSVRRRVSGNESSAEERSEPLHKSLENGKTVTASQHSMEDRAPHPEPVRGQASPTRTHIVRPCNEEYGRLVSNEWSLERIGERPTAAAAYSSYFADLDEWLEITGYHDRQYRARQLQRHRALAELDRQREQIENEGRMDLADRPYIPPSSFRSQSVQPAMMTGASAVPMGPPPVPTSTSRLRLTEYNSTHDKADNIQHTSTTTKTANNKRALPSGEKLSHEHVDKLIRLDTSAGAERGDDRALVSSARRDRDGYRIRDTVEGDAEIHRPPLPRPCSSHRYQARSVSPPFLAHRVSLSEVYSHRTLDKELPIPRSYSRRESREDQGLVPYDKHERPRSPTSHSTHQRYDHYVSSRFPIDHYDEPRSRFSVTERGRGRSRGRVYPRRGSSRPNYNDREKIEHYGGDGGGMESLDSQLGGTRYFIIKSWNHDNVDVAQRESVWATQPHNGGLLAEAFRSSKNVILFFSVNKSMAFQGYARMQSPPGAAQPPSWTKTLLWPTSGAFHIKWITVAETRFSRVGHLKNSLNEGRPVLVGRDGQEVEAECGRALCVLIDEAASEHERC